MVTWNRMDGILRVPRRGVRMISIWRIGVKLGHGVAVMGDMDGLWLRFAPGLWWRVPKGG